MITCKEEARVYFFCSARPILTGERSDQVSLKENAGVRNQRELRVPKTFSGAWRCGALASVRPLDLPPSRTSVHNLSLNSNFPI
jgi:hypothetical protein